MIYLKAGKNMNKKDFELIEKYMTIPLSELSDKEYQYLRIFASYIKTLEAEKKLNDLKKYL